MRYFVVISVVLTMLFLAQCQMDKQGGMGNDDAMQLDTTAIGEVKDRLAAIKNCATCHKDVYDNWLKGPHANAYKAIRAHIEHADTSKNFADSYRHYLNVDADLASRCYRCHTGSNVWESNFAGMAYETDTTRFKQEFYPNMNKAVFLRGADNPDNMLTGVDCLSCHKSGNHVVTNESYKPSGNKKMEGQCSPIASSFFSTNRSCRSCHIAQVRSMTRLVEQGRLEKEISCTSGCHQEYDDKGKGTHYFFWRHDAEGKVRSKDHHPFVSITTEIRKKGGKWNLQFSWVNDYMPHEFSACGDAVVITQVKDRNGKILAELTERANLKDEWLARDTTLCLRDGISGYHLILNDPPLISNLSFDGDPTGGTVLVRGLVKPQYWSTDGELEEQFRNEYPVVILD